MLNGYPDGAFCPNDRITRAEFAKIAAMFFRDEKLAGTPDHFTDIQGHWAESYINRAFEKGIVTGYPDGTYQPDQPITRAEAVTMVNRTLDRHPVKEHLLKDMLRWPDNLDTSKWYYAEMQEATNSHTYTMKNEKNGAYEVWRKEIAPRPWVELERVWSDAHSAGTNVGEVV